jgi:alkanesulfonate monooxygenase SsuD/methylene tetrahydromethanopterin reductase-like flavin-dependent oxidoreductase (luciferase family)
VAPSHTARRAIRYGDGWIPTARGDVTEVLAKFRDMAREAGRDPASIEITRLAWARILTG